MKNLASPSSLKAGNVLALLNTLYTSGFATSSPGLPMLKDRTMHTLYAFSFIVYSLNCTADWIHVYCTLRGYVTSFPLETWVVVSLVVTVVSGSMLSLLLLMLCVENAFAHRLDIKPYRSGLTIIAEAFVEWLQAFNNFRVAFLVLLLHDTPMTVLNFVFLSSCRCVSPQITPWSLLFSSLTTTVSILWRIVMLYFAYRRLVCPTRKIFWNCSVPEDTSGIHSSTFYGIFHNCLSNGFPMYPQSSTPTPGVYHFPTPHEHFLDNISTSEKCRLKEYDELWPIRWARKVVYGMDNGDKGGDDDWRKNNVGGFGLCCLHLIRLTRFSLCVFLSILAYLSFILACCLPCCYHYSCRRNSFHHRHAFARSCVRYSTYTFHYCIFVFSVLSSSLLFLLNLLLLSSVHVIGSHNVPPELSEMCVSLSSSSHSISLSLSSTPLLFPHPPPPLHDSIVCKPFWEDGGLSLGLRRRPAGPWQTRSRLSEREILAVSTQVIVNGTNKEKPFLAIKYDWAIIKSEGSLVHPSFRCMKAHNTQWNMSLPSGNDDPFPYFFGCSKQWIFEESHLIDCDDLEKKYTTTPPPRWIHYPMGKGAYYPEDGGYKRRKGKPKEEELDRGDMKRRRRRHRYIMKRE